MKKKSAIGLEKICKEVSLRTEIKKETVDKIVRAAFSVIKDILYNQETAHIPYFGSFLTIISPPRISQLPSGARVFTGSRIVPKFRYTASFRRRVSNIKIEPPEVDIPLIEGEEQCHTPE